MYPQWAVLGGLALTALGWLIPRVLAKAGWRGGWAIAIDMIGPFGLWVFLLAASGRPIFAGMVSLAVFGGFAFADSVKRATLREPVVFSDMAELIELFRHPELYLPFAGTGLVLGGLAAIVVALAALVWVEPGLWPWTPVPGLIGLGIVAAVTVAAGSEPLLSILARLARKYFAPSWDAAADAARLGPLAILPIHGTIARAERKARRAEAPMIRPTTSSPDKSPIVLIQAESFFDVRRVHPAIPSDLLPAFDRCGETGVQRGRFGVSGWGAYTIRAEFAALTGFSDEALGFDRWNPYHAFARAPLPSLASRLKAEGYRTICLHPFDKSFYGRSKILPKLGFDAFIGEEAFAGARRIGPYVADAEIATRANDILRDERGVFLFVITMENHGPWLGGDPRLSLPDPAPGLPQIAERDALRCFINGVKSADAMLQSICKNLSDGPGGLVALYGDHMPSLPGAFDALGFREDDTDYVIWQAKGGAGTRRDLRAYELAAALDAARHGIAA